VYASFAVEVRPPRCRAPEHPTPGPQGPPGNTTPNPAPAPARKVHLEHDGDDEEEEEGGEGDKGDKPGPALQFLSVSQVCKLS